VLIDSGASHKFFSSKLVGSLGLQVEQTPPFRVKLGYGHKKQTAGLCKILSFCSVSMLILRSISYLNLEWILF